MKTLMFSLLIVLVSLSLAVASGDKNRSSKGKGSVNTGSIAQGKADLTRAGR